MDAVLLLLKEKPGWANAQKLLAAPGFLQRLLNFNKDTTTEAIHKKLQRTLNDEDFNPVCDVVCKDAASGHETVTTRRAVDLMMHSPCSQRAYWEWRHVKPAGAPVGVDAPIGSGGLDLVDQSGVLARLAAY